MGPYVDENCNSTRDAVETDSVLQGVWAQHSGWHSLEGFWLSWGTPLCASVNVRKSIYVHKFPEEKRLGNPLFDWVLMLCLRDRLTAPKSGKLQVVPVQSD
eukprot:8957765-Pyramimonas_sp.AAC.1